MGMTKEEKDALRDKILEALKPVQDPEIRIGIVDLGLVYDVAVAENGNVRIKMTLTTPACPYGEMLVGQAHRAAELVEGVRKVEVALVWDPIWDPKTMCTDLAKDQLGIW
jgi:metal-sulfur cluster biosynthetic enzyme